jgi:hypothetical protein
VAPPETHGAGFVEALEVLLEMNATVAANSMNREYDNMMGSSPVVGLDDTYNTRRESVGYRDALNGQLTMQCCCVFVIFKYSRSNNPGTLVIWFIACISMSFCGDGDLIRIFWIFFPIAFSVF